MRIACDHSWMVMIQVRDVPEDLHRALKARAETEGVTLTELIRRELPRIAEMPSMATWLRMLEQRDPKTRADGGGEPRAFAPGNSPTEILREERDRR